MFRGGFSLNRLSLEFTGKAKDPRPEYDAASEQMGEILYNGFSEDGLAEAEQYLSGTMRRLAEREK